MVVLRIQSRLRLGSNHGCNYDFQKKKAPTLFPRLNIESRKTTEDGAQSPEHAKNAKTRVQIGLTPRISNALYIYLYSIYKFL